MTNGLARSVLITGGSGSAGHAFTRRLLDLGVSRVCIFSRDEYKQHVMREEFGNDDRLRWFVGCVRDRDRLRRAMEGIGWVISAAALKRVETSEQNPSEVIKTNVVGTINVIEAAHDAGVKRIMGISSDKAPAAANVYGATKFLSEKLLIAANNVRGAYGPVCSCARYGNIFNSRGSVVPTWKRMIANGATEVPVTDPECTRYFMRVDHAAQFVIDSMVAMRGGEVFIPVLPAYRLGDLAEAMGVGMDIVGLGESEKKHETMDGVTTSEQARRMTVDELRSELELI